MKDLQPLILRDKHRVTRMYSRPSEGYIPEQSSVSVLDRPNRLAFKFVIASIVIMIITGVLC
jgi:hypothetical protein